MILQGYQAGGQSGCQAVGPSGRQAVRQAAELASATAVHEAVERGHAALEGRGRVLLRPSGTEPLVRVMVEAPTADEAHAVCERLVELVEAELA